MKCFVRAAAQIGIFLLVCLFFGCFGTVKLVNTQELDAQGIERITLAYGEGNVALLESPTEKIILQEYMNRDDEDTYARISAQDGEMNIQTGKRPVVRNLNCRLEFYLPAGYGGEVELRTEGGKILSSAELVLESFTAETHSGKIELSGLSAEKLSISAQSGSIFGEDLTGEDLEIRSISGNIKIEGIDMGRITIGTEGGNMTGKEVTGEAACVNTSGWTDFSMLSGFGSFQSTSGNLDIEMGEMAGSLTVSTESGGIHGRIPGHQPLCLSARSGSGTVRADYAYGLSMKKNEVSGTIEGGSVYMVSFDSGSGNIEVKLDD